MCFSDTAQCAGGLGRGGDGLLGEGLSPLGLQPRAGSSLRPGSSLAGQQCVDSVSERALWECLSMPIPASQGAWACPGGSSGTHVCLRADLVGLPKRPHTQVPALGCAGVVRLAFGRVMGSKVSHS